MRVLDDAYRLDLVAADIVFQLSPEDFGLVEARDRTDVIGRPVRGGVRIAHLSIAVPWTVGSALPFTTCPLGKGDFEDNVVRSRIVGHDGGTERALGIHVERQRASQGVQDLDTA